MNKILFVSLLLLVSSCSAQEVKNTDLSTIHNDTYVSCSNKLDGSEVDYLMSQRHDIPSTFFSDVMISEIIDTHNKHWSINTMEWTNFTCTEKKLP